MKVEHKPSSFIECKYCGAKNSFSSISCYACGRSLPPPAPDNAISKEPESTLENDEKSEAVEIELSACELCKMLGRDKDSMGLDECMGCKHNPNMNRDIGCGCLFLIVLLILLGVLNAVS